MLTTRGGVCVLCARPGRAGWVHVAVPAYRCRYRYCRGHEKGNDEATSTVHDIWP